MALKPKTQKAVVTAPKQLKPFEWAPGQSGNPKGRPKGVRTKFAETFLKDFLADWEVAGASAIQACRLEDPGVYVRIAASLVPKEFSLKNGENDLDAIIDQFSDEQLAQFHGLVASLGAGSQAKPGQTKTLT